MPDNYETLRLVHKICVKCLTKCVDRSIIAFSRSIFEDSLKGMIV